MHARCYNKLNCPGSWNQQNECQFAQATATLRLFMTIPHSLTTSYIPFISFHPLQPIQSFTEFACLQHSSHLKRWKLCQFHIILNIFETYFHIFPWAWSNHPPFVGSPTGGSEDSICGCLSSHRCGEEELWGHDLQSDELQTILPTFERILRWKIYENIIRKYEN